MPAVSQKIRTGVVELRADIGSVYVSPSFWERLYLLWTFRNFHSLPKQVLNRSQRRLIDKLCRTAIVNRNGPIARTSIIGAVENVQLMPGCKAKAATTSKLVAMGTTSADVVAPRAVGAEQIPIRSSRAAPNRTDAGRFPGRSAKVHYISGPQKDSAEQSGGKETTQAPVDSDAGRTRRRNRPKWALVVACWAALLGILLYFQESRRARPITGPQVAVAAHRLASGSIPSAVVMQQETVQQPVLAERKQPGMIIAPSGPPPAGASRQHERTPRKTLAFTQPSVAIMVSAPAERLQVAEPPERGFSYPVAPNPALSGKVSLKAVIGTDGSVEEIDVISGNRVLAGAALRAVSHWRYRPYKLNGDAVEVETNIMISFVGDAVSVSFPAPH